jgi:putative DNA primase/helicase
LQGLRDRFAFFQRSLIGWRRESNRELKERGDELPESQPVHDQVHSLRRNWRFASWCGWLHDELQADMVGFAQAKLSPYSNKRALHRSPSGLWCDAGIVADRCLMYENEQQLRHHLDAFGCKLRPRDDLIGWIDKGRHTCGKGGKFWVNLHSFSPRGTNRRFIVGAFGDYRDKRVEKVEWDRESLTDELREQYRKEQAAAREREQREAAEAHATAALSAAQLWHEMSRTGVSTYLARKGVDAEACRYTHRWVRIARRDPTEKDMLVPPGSLVLPLIRYDMPREEALRGLQFIKPDGFKLFTEGFGKRGCSLRLGDVDDWTEILMVCEGYATGLSIRMATGRSWPVFVCLDAGNLADVIPLLRALYPNAFILVCADDDWKTKNHEGPNPGRTAARKVARGTERCDIVWPVFDPRTRAEKDTDFNDLHIREGLGEVEDQLQRTIRIVRAREFGVVECDGV